MPMHRGEGGAALVVEDDPSLLGFLAQALPDDRFAVLAAGDAAEALAILRRSRADVAVVDVGLPGMSGIDLIEAVRRGGTDEPWDPALPVIAVSGRDDPHAPVRALERGADDYLAKPFYYPELLARVSALLRRSRRARLTGDLVVGPVAINPASRRVTVHDDALELSAKEFALLVALARDPDRVVTKDELLRDVWGYVGRARTRTVDSHASRLRCKLAQAGADGLVANVWGIGYRLRDDA
jgi:DNA-binding response OmpR family regulator